jgi:nitroreductase
MPTAISPEALLQSLRWRYATKRFDASRTIPAAAWAALEEALVLTPSSFGLQPWKFIVITDLTTKRALVPFSWNQTQVADCSHHVVFAIKKGITLADVDRFTAAIAESRGVAVETLKGYREMMAGFIGSATEQGWIDVWATRQVYIALGQFMTSAALLGVDACPMEGIDPAQYDDFLGLKAQGYQTVVACAAGYRAADDKYATLPKVRYPAAEIVQHFPAAS